MNWGLKKYGILGSQSSGIMHNYTGILNETDFGIFAALLNDTAFCGEFLGHAVFRFGVFCENSQKNYFLGSKNNESERFNRKRS